MKRPRQHTADKSCAGKSIIEMLEGRLDEVVDKLMGKKLSEKKRLLLQERGRAYSEAIALMKNPYFENVDAVINESLERLGYTAVG